MEHKEIKEIRNPRVLEEEIKKLSRSLKIEKKLREGKNWRKTT